MNSLFFYEISKGFCFQFGGVSVKINLGFVCGDLIAQNAAIRGVYGSNVIGFSSCFLGLSKR